jgi:superfamily II DNA or RNA helicase
MIKFRPYQQTLYDDIQEHLEKGFKSILVQAETGWGKSILIGALANNLEGRTLILTHRIELLKQNSEWINDVGILTAKQKKNVPLKSNKNIIAMTQTAYARFNKFGFDYVGDFDNVIVDETHVDFFKQVYKGLDIKVLIGLTATPIIYKNEKKEVNGAEFARKLSLADDFEVLLQGVSASDLIDLGYLTEDKYTRLTPPNLDKLKKSANNPDGYTPSSMTEVFGSHASVAMVMKAYKEISLGNKTIIFNPTTKVNVKVYDAFVKEGYGDLVKMFDSVNVTEISRTEIVDWYKNTKGAILLNVGVFTTGFNVPDIETIIYNKATLSLSLWLQSCGRGSRVCEGKEFFRVIDLGLNLERHGFWSADRDWKEFFKIHTWKQKLPSDNLNVWECTHCGSFNLKGTLYNEVLDRVECYNCHQPKPERKQNENHIKGELVEVYVPRVPRSASIVAYGKHCGNDSNISFRLLNKKIIDLFHHHTDRNDYWKRRNKYIERLVNIYRPCYFAIINSDLQGANKTLNKSIERIVDKLDKHYK